MTEVSTIPRTPRLPVLFPSVITYPDLKVGRNVELGNYSFVGRNVSIGDDVTIGMNVVLEGDSKIGSRVVIDDCVIIKKGVNIADCQRVTLDRETEFNSLKSAAAEAKRPAV